MGLIGGPSTTTLIPRVVNLQHISNPCELGASGLEYPTIFNKTLTDLIILNPKKNFLALVIVPYNNLISYLHIIYYFAGIDFA